MRAERKLMVFAWLGAGAFALSGCSYSPQDTRAAYETSSDTTPTERPLAQLPAQAGSVIAVLQSRANGVLTQRVVLAGDTGVAGENSILVKLAERPGPDSKSEIASWRPTETSIAQELDTAFPTIEMQISNGWNRNEFGPFGYALGEGQKNVVCGYAWQYSPGSVVAPFASQANSAYSFAATSTPASVRVRLCRTGLTESDFVAYVKAMAVLTAGGGGGPTVIYSGIGSAAESDAAPDSTPKARAPVHKKAAHRKHRAAPQPVVVQRVEPREEPKPTPVVEAVPLPNGAPLKNSAAAEPVNPLLAPLQGGGAQRPLRTAEDMPLPGRLNGDSKPVGDRKASDPEPMPMPLPN